MSQRNTQKHGFKTVRGFVLEVPSRRRDSDEEDEEEDEEDNWLDYSQIRNAFSQGTFVRQNKKPRICNIRLQDLDHPNQTQRCFGRFVLLDPWWELTVTISPNKHVRGSIQYKVRQDEDGIRKHNLVPFLLNSALLRCLGERQADELMKLCEGVIRNQLRRTVTFEDIDPLLNRFTQTHPEHKEIIKQVRNRETIQAVLRGVRYPDLLQFLCRLFPLTFLNCLLAPAEMTLEALETAARDEPWVFGFRAILASRFKVYGLEANYKAFEACDLMENIPPAEKDALYIYEVLKTDASKNGHTYISFMDLCQHYHWSRLNHDVSDWASALTFLTQNGVTKEERFDSGRNVFLYHNWKAEVDIAEGLQEVLSRAIQASEPAWAVDFASPDLSRLRGDHDQWLAAQKVVGSPVCILSGKGGCGKTTVVTQVLQNFCQQMPETDEHATEDMDDILANAELHQVTGMQGDRKKGSTNPPATPQLTQEQVSQMIEAATQALQESQALETPHRSSQEKRKQGQIKIELITDLIKYLSTTGDTALSRTPNGRKILLTAPTGKAAKLLGHKAKMESCTLHRVIYSYRAFVQQQKKNMEEKKKQGWDHEDNEQSDGEDSGPPVGSRTRTSPQKNPCQPPSNNSADNSEDGVWKYACTEVLIVDECSLVSLRIFATLLNILLENTPLIKIVLLGDVRQLPSIEPGNFLSDMFDTFKGRGLSVELRTNHRSESELIVSNATKISNRRLPVIDPSRHFHLLAMDNSKDSGDPERDAAVRDLLNSQLELQSHETSQFVAFRRCDCDAINELCCKHFNNHATKEAREGRQRYDFRVGDKICFRKNGQVLNHRLKLKGYLQNCPQILDAFGIQSKLRGKNSLKGYLQNCPQILDAFGIQSKLRGKNSRKKNAPMDVTAATEQILNSDGDEENKDELPRATSDHGYGCATNRQLNLFPVFQNTRTENGGRDVSGPRKLQPPRVTVKQEKLVGDENGTVDSWNEKIAVDHSSHGSHCDGNHHSVAVKQEKLWGDENVAAEYSDGCCSADYHVQATELGIKMEHPSQMMGAATAGQRRLRLENIGAEEGAAGHSGSSQESCSSSSSHDNDDDEEERASKLKNGEVRLCNGEVFFILDDVMEANEGGKENRYLTLSDRDPEYPRVVCASYAAVKRECRMRHAWARTIHTYQGSESDTVVYYVGESKIQNWKHVYTAVTRGRKSVFIVGKESELRQAVQRGVRPRRSRLSRRLQDSMKDLSFQVLCGRMAIKIEINKLLLSQTHNQKLHARMREINDQAEAAPLLPAAAPLSTNRPSVNGSALAPDSPEGPPGAVSPSVLHAFLDSDDSWVKDMSPVWVADYQASKESKDGASRTDGSPDLFQNNPDLNSSTEGEEEEDLGTMLSKMRRLQEQALLTGMNRGLSDPIDSIISPVKRTLSIE